MNIEWVDTEPEINVEDYTDEWKRALEYSENEENSDDSVDDEITEHLRWIILQKQCCYFIYVWLTSRVSTYILCSQQKLIGEIEVSQKENNSNDSTDYCTACWHMNGEDSIVISLSEQQATDDANDWDGWGDHSPPRHYYSSKLEVQKEQEFI